MTTITALPAAPDPDDGQAVFDAAAEALVAAWPTFISETNTVAGEVNTNASNAATSASNASTSATSATTKASEASASAATAVNAPGTAGTSTTSLTIGTGTQSLTTQTGKAWVVGQPVMIARTAAPSTTWMAGTITAYTSGTGALEVSVTTGYTQGSGTHTDWTISLTAPTPASIAYALLSVPPGPAVVAMSTSAPALSDLTTYSTSPVVTAPTNAQAVPSAVTTSDGWSVATGFVAGTLASLASSHVATAHGSWGSKTMTPPALATIAGSGTNTLLGSVQLDTNLVVLLYRDGANVQAVAVNTSTNTAGTPVTVCAYNSDAGAGVYKVDTTTYVAAANHAAVDFTLRAGSVDTGTLAITQGAAATGGTAELLAAPTRLSASLYVLAQDTGSMVRAFSVAGTTVTLGAAVEEGAANTGVGYVALARASDTEVLIAYLTGVSNPHALAARIGSVSGTTITLQTAATAATTVEKTAGLRVLQPFSEGASYMAVCQDDTTSTTGNYYGITVSGTTVTLGTVTARASDLPVQFRPRTFVYQPARAVITYGSTAVLFGHLTAGPYAVTISGTALTFGSSLSLGGVATTFLNDFAGTSYYAVGTAAFDKFTVSAATISSSWQVAVAPTIVASDTLTDKAASYASTWHKWTLPSMATALTAAKWLYDSGNDFIVAGPIT